MSRHNNETKADRETLQVRTSAPAVIEHTNVHNDYLGFFATAAGDTPEVRAHRAQQIVECWNNYPRLQAAVKKFLSASGHDLCQENRRELALAAGLGAVDLPTPEKVSRAEFQQGCASYTRELYGEPSEQERVLIDQYRRKDHGYLGRCGCTWDRQFGLRCTVHDEPAVLEMGECPVCEGFGFVPTPVMQVTQVRLVVAGLHPEKGATHVGYCLPGPPSASELEKNRLHQTARQQARAGGLHNPTVVFDDTPENHWLFAQVFGTQEKA